MSGQSLPVALSKSDRNYAAYLAEKARECATLWEIRTELLRLESLPSPQHPANRLLQRLLRREIVRRELEGSPAWDSEFGYATHGNLWLEWDEPDTSDDWRGED